MSSVLDERALELTTPEGVVLRMRLAGPVERGMALFLDLAIVILATLLVGLIALFFISAGASEMLALVILAIFLIRHGYFAFFEIHWHGATPAKRLLGMRVISRDGAGLTANSVIARNLTRDVEMFLPLAALFGPDALVGQAPWWLWIPASGWIFVFALLPVVSKERTRAGDIIAGTIVVTIPKPVLLEDKADHESMHDVEIVFSREQLSAYGEKELETLADILEMAGAGRANRVELRKIAITIARKIGYRGQEPSANPLRFLRAFYKQQRAELERRLLHGQRISSKHDR